MTQVRGRWLGPAENIKVACGWIPGDFEATATRPMEGRGCREREEGHPGFRPDQLEGRTTVHCNGKTIRKVGAGGKENQFGSSYSTAIFPGSRASSVWDILKMGTLVRHLRSYAGSADTRVKCVGGAWMEEFGGALSLQSHRTGCLSLKHFQQVRWVGAGAEGSSKGAQEGTAGWVEGKMGAGSLKGFG